ncbi:MAG TPA: FAD-dependent oxidoreductase [Arachnia sp.]|nr:FAD-dependent oxidoreductase [Arachnia sp.]HMT86846.1 FAD-dependent oxidoreductase [Arachnia sp.]
MSMIVIGAGFAGGTAVTELREQGYDGRVILYGAEPHPPYERPPLSKGFLLGDDALESIFVHERGWYDEHDVELRLGTTVTGIDLAAHRVQTADGAQDYERLLLATGSSPRRLPLAESAGPPVAYLRTIEDSERLKAALVRGGRVAVVGAGWIGLEVAAAARTLGCVVTVHGRSELPLVGVLGPEVAQLFADLHRAHGVEFRLGAEVRAEDLGDADLVVVGIGAEPRVGLAEQAGLAVDDGVLVDATLRTGDPDVFAVGDIANQQHPKLGRRIRVEHWDTASEQAKVAARNMLGGAEAYDRMPYFFTDQYDLGMEYVGSVGPEGYDRVVIEGDTDVTAGGAFRAYWVAGGTVVAAMQANDWDASDEIWESLGRPA